MNIPHGDVTHRILVVDDNVAIHKDFLKILNPPRLEDLDDDEAAVFGSHTPRTSRVNFELSFATQGSEALELVKSAAQTGRRYAVVFTDVRMPPGWDGLTTTSKLWEIDSDLQVVICTAYSDRTWREMMETLQYPERVLILKKPFDATEVLQLAHSLTEKWTLLQASRRNVQDLEKAVELRTHELQLANRHLELEIASHQKTESALRKSEQSLAEKAALLDKAQDAIFVHDLSDHVVYWNRSAERLYEWPLGEALGQDLHLRIHSDPAQWKNAREKTFATGEWVGELSQVTRSGRKLTVESRWTLIRDEENRPHAILVINTDVTEKRQLEARFLRAQRMESIGALAGGIAHDLNNILHPISLSMEMFRAHFPETADRGMLDLVLASVERATSLIKQVLTFARGSEGERIAIPTSTLVHEIETIVRATFPKTITFESRVDTDIWPVRGDATQLHQVLLNLCVNARDAMADGGSLFFTVENAKVDELQAAMQSKAVSGRYVAFVVTDTGLGIPASIREKIFDPFFTTKEQGKGSGLGLATSLGIIRSHNGFITVESAEGLGTTFRVFVPAAESTESASETTAGAGIADLHGNGELILIVDDEAAILKALRATLERFGYQVLCATDGAEGISLYAQNATKPAVVLTDICMPHMNGVALIGALKRLDHHAKVIATTGMTSVANTDAIHELGVERFISKPFDSQTVLRALKHILSGSTPQPGPSPASIFHNS